MTRSDFDQPLNVFHPPLVQVKDLDRLVTAKAGFSRSYMVTGQTYSRKVPRRFYF